MFNEAYLKFLVISAMSILLLLLLWSGIKFLYGYHTKFILWHVASALFFCVLVLSHLYLHRTILKKLLLKCFIKEPLNSHFLKEIKKRSFNEICVILNYDRDIILAMLITKNIKIRDPNIPLDIVAKENQYDPFKLFSLITAIHIYNKEK